MPTLTGLLTAGLPSSDSTIEANATWVWDSTANAIYIPMELAANSTWNWTSSGDAAATTPVTLSATSQWVWTSAGTLTTPETGPRDNDGVSPSSGGARGTTGTPTSSTRGSTGTPT